MDIRKQNNIYKEKLSNAEFIKLSTYIQDEYGIKMPSSKRIMLQSRLYKRLNELNIRTYKEYVEYLFSKQGALNGELINLVNQITTNKTDFFRENNHFEILSDTVLPRLLNNANHNRLINVWSAGSSVGAEAYTIAIVLNEYSQNKFVFDYHIFATDISTKVLKVGINAIYDEANIENISIDLKKKYFLRSKERIKKTVRISPLIRSKVTFSELNLMDSVYGIKQKFDIVFCRNTLIYFNAKTQEKVINKLCLNLKIGGYFFLGHSESIISMNVPLIQIAPTVFVRK